MEVLCAYVETLFPAVSLFAHEHERMGGKGTTMTKHKNSFNSGFSIKLPTGSILRFGRIEYPDDDKVSLEGLTLNVDGDVTQLPPGSLWTEGYHDHEHGEWKAIEA